MKALKLAIVTLLFSVAIPMYAHAGFFDSYAQIYTVGSVGSTAAQNVFTLNQDPTLFIQLYSTPPTDTSLLTRTTDFTVTAPNGTYFPFTYSNANQFWSAYPQSVWNSIKTTGTWTVSAESFGNNITDGIFSGSTSFKVVAAPEPMGVLLFLTGAMLMGFSFLRRRKLIAA